MRKALYAVLTTFALVWATLAPLPVRGQQASSYVAGRRIAQNYAYGFGQVPGAHVAVGNSATGVGTVTVCPAIRALPDGRVVNIFQSGILNPVTFDLGTASSETITPTSVSIVSPAGLTVEADQNCAAITGTFSFTHAPSQFTSQVRSGTFGLQEAINDAAPSGLIEIGDEWGGTNAILAAAVPYPGVSIEDTRLAATAYWSIAPTTASFLAVPTTLTSTTVGFGLNGANTTSGTYTGTSTYHVCVSYVDIAGNEGPCSLDFSGLTAGTGSANQIGIAAPAASTGAVGYTVYISLASGTYALAYQVPLTSSVCKLTLVESITPACVVINSNYNQTVGSNAIVSALTVNTSPLALQLGAASTTADYVGNSNAHTTYGYVQGTKLALGGIIGTSLNFTAGPATVATTVPQVLGTIAIPTGYMNTLGRTIRVCGKVQFTGAAATIEQIQLWWDGAGSDTAGVPVLVGNIIATGTGSAVAYNENFCDDLTPTVVGSGVTAGSMMGGASWLIGGIVSTGAADYSGFDNKVATTGSLNLAGGTGFTTRLHIVQLHTGGTDVSPQLVHLTIESL
jgi:hypothetical protein